MTRQFIHLFFFFSIMLSTVANSAMEFIPEANVRAPYGTKGDSWSLYWTGICAPRVGVDAGYMGPALLREKKAEVIAYLHDSIKYVAAKCADVETVHVRVFGGKKEQPTGPAMWRLEMHKADDWVAKKMVWFADGKIAELHQQGAVAVEGGLVFRRALLWIDEDTVRGIYGPKFDGKLVGESFSKKMNANADKPSVDYYEVKGYWYELGYFSNQPVCDQPRDGYPQWGSFTLRVTPYGSSSYLNRAFCVDSGQAGKSERIMLRNPFNKWLSVPKYQSVNDAMGNTDGLKQFANQLSTMAISEGMDAEAFLAQRQPLYQNEKLTIYAKSPEFCIERSFDVYYPGSSKERDNDFHGQYKEVVGATLNRLLREKCKEATKARVYNAQLGSEKPWDSHTFQFKPLTKAEQYLTLTYPRVVDYRAYDEAQAYEQRKEQNHFGARCEDLPFCDLPAGTLLNAIYRGDSTLLKQAELRHQKEFDSRFGKLSSDQAAVVNLLKRIANHQYGVGLMVMAANKYMYDYPKWGEQCFATNASAKTFVETVDSNLTINFDGSIDSEPGEQKQVTYKTNAEFVDLRDRIGPIYMGAPSKNKKSLTTSYRLLLEGIENMQRNYDCNSKEVKQFEQNLIRFTQRQMAKEPLDTNIQPSPVLQKGKQKSPTTNRPSGAGVAIGQDANVFDISTRTDKPSSTADNPAVVKPAKSPQLTQQDKLQAMVKELEALSASYTELVQQRQAELKQDLNSADSAQQRNKIMMDFQAYMQKIQVEAKHQTDEVKRKYQYH